MAEQANLEKGGQKEKKSLLKPVRFVTVNSAFRFTIEVPDKVSDEDKVEFAWERLHAVTAALNKSSKATLQLTSVPREFRKDD